MTTTEPTIAEHKKGLKRGRAFVSWRRLRSIGNSRAAKLTVLIPLVGYLILLNDDIVKHLELSQEVFGAAASETLTKLLAVYVGLVLVAIASVIFAACCPLEVKRYASAQEYVAGDEPFMSQRAFGVLQSRLRVGDRIAREDHANYTAHFNSRPTPSAPEDIRRRNAQHNRIEMNLYYEMLDRSRWLARWAAAVLYAAGLGFLLVPSASVFWHVMKVLGHRLGVL
ncbi:hypothetical protein [Bradyrhizobium sp. USDA 4473]